MVTEKLERKYMRNDILWEAYNLIDTDKGYEFFKFKHWGYNDANYWHNVIPYLPKCVEVTGDKGTKIKVCVDYIADTIVWGV